MLVGGCPHVPGICRSAASGRARDVRTHTLSLPLAPHTHTHTHSLCLCALLSLCSLAHTHTHTHTHTNTHTHTHTSLPPFLPPSPPRTAWPRPPPPPRARRLWPACAASRGRWRLTWSCWRGSRCTWTGGGGGGGGGEVGGEGGRCLRHGQLDAGHRRKRAARIPTSRLPPPAHCPPTGALVLQFQMLRALSDDDGTCIT